MLRILHQLSHFVLETIAVIINAISQVIALCLISVIGGNKWEWWASAWAGPQRMVYSQICGWEWGVQSGKKACLVIYDLKLPCATYVLCLRIPFLFLIPNIFCLCNIISGPTIQTFNQVWAIFKILPLYLLHIVKANLKVTVKRIRQFSFDIFPTWPWKISRSFSVYRLSLLPLCSLLTAVLGLTSVSQWMFFTCPSYLSDK